MGFKSYGYAARSQGHLLANSLNDEEYKTLESTTSRTSNSHGSLIVGSTLHDNMYPYDSWSGSLTTVLVGIIAPCIVYVSLTCFLNIFLHPLRHLNGPLMARASTIWGKIGRYNGCKSERIHEAHIKYGPVVRIGPNEVSFADPQAVHQIYDSDKFVKEHDFYWAKRMCHEDHLVTFRDPVAHRKRRKLLSRGFSQAAMREFEPILSAKIQTMLDQWGRLSAKPDPIDAYVWAHWLAFDAVYHLLFDQDLESLEAGKPAEIMRYLSARKPMETYQILLPGVGYWGRYLPGPIGNSFRMVVEWKNVAVNIIDECKTNDIKTPFLRSVLSGEKDDFLGRELTDSELATEMMGGMVGGSGTTANTFVYTLWACVQDQAVTSRLRKELRDAFPDKEAVPDFSTCQSLPYLQAVINESLRLYPVIIATLPRTAKTDVVIAGIRIPAGTTVGTQNLTIHRDPVAFPQPTEFRPERWLEDGPHKQLMKTAWNPFSTGSRKCIGINLALMELSKLVAAFFLRFEHVKLHETMKIEDMRMYDTFNAKPIGEKLLIHVK